MTYQRSASAQKMVDAACTKLIVYYTDGNARTMWGRNGLNGGRVAADPESIEVLRHKKYVAANAASIKTAIIYAKSGAELHRFSKGSWV
ncbi:hypothetical protein LJY25_08285 [Hymenobacter sp. BT175]|uniref:hypothetical protein n=1 Tax=Hymenobacter translucens TaxID=2886507 RepID=UPI001D0EF829|nr:hypothetical protein [Hymenobacter translucens]MCC2546440.1 hypothetical protein [Hymenobacter translucens]